MSDVGMSVPQFGIEKNIIHSWILQLEDKTTELTDQQTQLKKVFENGKQCVAQENAKTERADVGRYLEYRKPPAEQYETGLETC